MKKRIIAALTALVMVVTMIPANAFASSEIYDLKTDLGKVQKQIETLIFGDQTTDFDFSKITLESKSDLEKAETAYAALSDADKKKMQIEWSKAQDSKVNYDDLVYARGVYNKLVADKAAYDAAERAILAGGVLEATPTLNPGPGQTDATFSTAEGSASKALTDAYNASKGGDKHFVIENGVAKEVATGGQTITVAANLPTVNPTIETMFGASLATTKVSIANAIGLINKITLKDVESANVNDVPDSYKAAKAVLYTGANKTDINGGTAEGTAKVIDFAIYAKGYTYYQAIEAKIDAPKDFKDAVAKLTDNNLANDGSDIAKGDIEAEPKTPDQIAGLALVNGGNAAKAKAFYNEIKAVYDKYVAMPEYNKNTDLAEMKAVLDGLKKHIAKYDYAVEQEKFINDLTAKKTLSMEEIAKVNEIAEVCSASKVIDEYFKYSNKPAYQQIDYYLASDKLVADKRVTTAKFADLVVKANEDAASYAPADAYEKYGKAIATEMNKISSLTTVNYATDKEAIMNVAKLFNEFKANAALYKVTTHAEIPQFVVTSYDNLLKDAKSHAGNNMAEISSQFEGYVSEAVYDEFILKCNRLNSYVDEYTSSDVSGTVLTAIADYIPKKVYGGTADTGSSDKAPKKPITTVNCETVEGLVADYNKSVSALSKDVKVVYDYKQNEIASNEDTKYTTDAARIAYLQVRIDATKAIETTKEQIKDLTAKIVTLKDGNLSNAQLADNKAILADIDKILANEDVKNVFFGLDTAQTSVQLEPEYLSTGAAASGYYYDKYINAYLSAKKATGDVELSANIDDVIKAIDALKVTDDNNANLNAYNDVLAKYNALSPTDKYLVTNFNKVALFEKNAADKMVVEVEKEMKKLGVVGNILDAAQLKTMEDVAALLSKYEVILVAANVYDPAPAVLSTVGDMFKAPFDISGTTPFDYAPATAYFAALKIVDVDATAKVIKEEIAPVYKDLEALSATAFGGSGYVALANPTPDQKAVAAKAIDTYKKLSSEAKAVLVRTKTATDVKELLGVPVLTITKASVDAMLAIENDIKASILDYAKIDAIEDQVFADKAVTPEVVVKDINGKVIDNAKLVVKFNSNTQPGTAEVIVTPADGSALAGVVKATFNIVEAEKPLAPVKPEVTVDTDNGILKVVASQEAEGLSYRFQIRKDGATKWTTRTSESNETVFTGLDKNTAYEVQVATVLDKDVSEYNYIGFVYTNRVGNRYAAMYKPAIKNVTIKNRVAKITVNKVNYNKVQYALGYKKAGAKNFKWFAPNAKTVKTLTNLKKGVKYTFSIRYQYTSEVSGTVVKNPKWAKYVTKVAK